MIPAAIDSTYHNRTPIYPPEAARRGQQGTVVLMIHVAASGLPTAVDIAQSSGYVVLDREAREKIETWRFRPAVEGGLPVPFDMPFRVVFSLQ